MTPNSPPTQRLGRTDATLPEVGMGTWRYSSGPEPLVAGIEAGSPFIDTAESYGNEAVVADAIRGCRDKVFLASKVSPAHFRRAEVVKAAEDSLRRLRTDRIDLYQLHEPNPGVPIEETLGAMQELADAGKIRWIGVSNFSVDQLRAAQRAATRHPIVSNQVRFNLVDRTIATTLLPYCQSQGVTVIAYSPLSRQFQHLLDGDPRGVLQRLALDTGRTRAQLALNWCLGHEGVVVIPKSGSVAHAIENAGAGGWRLSSDEMRALTDAIQFRQRSRWELWLRQGLPPGAKKLIQGLSRMLPPAIRRKIQ
ncbi:MAG: aldo/keto reductase [Verrucomicrobia bacterium]|nr:aldo/keto reductase [Verrucomicrobiota bacterium]MBI3870799.1 aldo/keto reductase [Verrucomicrobiota bacterium]